MAALKHFEIQLNLFTMATLHWGEKNVAIVESC